MAKHLPRRDKIEEHGDLWNRKRLLLENCISVWRCTACALWPLDQGCTSSQEKQSSVSCWMLQWLWSTHAAVVNLWTLSSSQLSLCHLVKHAILLCAILLLLPLPRRLCDRSCFSVIPWFCLSFCEQDYFSFRHPVNPLNTGIHSHGFPAESGKPPEPTIAVWNITSISASRQSPPVWFPLTNTQQLYSKRCTG